MSNEIIQLARRYFEDLARDSREDTRENFRGWLWFTCPAHLREQVAEEIESQRQERSAE